METFHVDIAYRPLRIAWAIKDGDFEAFRAAVRTSFAFWGGRFNPIIVVDHEELARDLISVFRADVIIPVGEGEEVKSFPKKFPHLITPYQLQQGLFMDDAQGGASSSVLDIVNALAYVENEPEWKAAKERFRAYTWTTDDPLSDVFLMHFGAYPNKEKIKIDYRGYLLSVTQAKEIAIADTLALPADLFDYPSIAYLSRFGVQQHYGAGRGGRDIPGFFSGDASNLDDLVCYWNLRACDIPLLFVDIRHLARYGEALGYWGKAMRDAVSHRRLEFDRRIGVWLREPNVKPDERVKALENAIEPFRKEEAAWISSVGDGTWNGLNVRPPMMYLDSVSTLGVVDTSSRPPKLSFALDKKPFSADHWFHTQMLVASLHFIGGLGDEENLWVPPYVPELNEFYSRNMHFEYDKIRSESERIGVIIDATDSSATIAALPVFDVAREIFGLAGFTAGFSSAGLITRQLITQLGGVDGARAFKIPGVRRLLKTHGPTAAFTKGSAIQLIASKDPENPTASFKDYENLYGGHHPYGTELNPDAVFAYLVEKGLFRMGAELQCPNCRMKSWTALDLLKQRVTCEMCGQEFDATRQLVDGNWHFRRSGVLGAEKNAQGAIPVIMILQQFRVNLSSIRRGFYVPSLELVPHAGKELPTCETDFTWVIPEPYPEKTIVIIGECKDRGGQGDAGSIDSKDVENLKRVADSLPSHRFQTYIVLAKLAPFTPEEITVAKSLNDRYNQRAILLTNRELEPYHFYERTALEFNNLKGRGSRPEDLAINTAIMYFNE